jgi:hypothetical protein
VPRVGTLEKQIVANYNGANSVTCQMSVHIDDGHHSCTSCALWEKFVNALKELLEIKTAKVDEIKNNKRNIETLCQLPTKHPPAANYSQVTA